jgi:hypothetical protein
VIRRGGSNAITPTDLRVIGRGGARRMLQYYPDQPKEDWARRMLLLFAMGVLHHGRPTGG